MNTSWLTLVYTVMSEEYNFTDEDHSDKNSAVADGIALLRERRWKASQRPPPEVSFASQIQAPRITALVDEEDDEKGINDKLPLATAEDKVSTCSKNEVFLIFIISCICLCYTTGMYIVLSIRTNQRPEFSLLKTREFTAQMISRDKQVQFFVKANYQPKSKDELTKLWTDVEHAWESNKTNY